MTARRRLAAVPDQPLRALLYVRVSALMGRGGDTFLSPEIQTGTMRRALPMHGLREVGVIDDDIDVSGTSFVRDGLDKVRQMAEARQFDVLLCYDTSRFGRDVLESLLFLRDLSQRGVHIIAVSEGIDTSSDHGMTMLINMLNVAQLRAKEIGRGWRSVIATRARDGKWHGGVPGGYRVGEDGRLKPDPTTGPAAAAAFRDYADGVANAEVRRRYKDATGRQLSAIVLKHMLTNEVYLGVVQIGEVRVEHAHDPLVDEVTWERVQRRVRRARIEPPRHQSPQYSLTGLGKCGSCMGHTIVMPHAKRGYLQVRCGSGQEASSPCRGCGAAQLPDVEAAMLAEVRAYAGRLRGDIGAAAAQRARATRAGVDAATIERELADTRRAMVRVTTRWAREPDDQVYEQSMAQLRDEEARLVAQLDRTQDAAAGLPPERVIALADRLVELWPRMDGGQRNRALRELVDHVVVRPSTRWRQPAAERIEVCWL